MDYTCDPLVKSVCEECVSDSDSDSESDQESVDEHAPILKETLTPLNSLDMEDLDPIQSVIHSVEVKSIDLKTVELESDMKHIIVEEVVLDEPQEFTVTLEETNYSKMSMKQLKDVLSSKGIKVKPNIRKDDLIELITKENTNTLVSF
jgi:hypothetical protein